MKISILGCGWLGESLAYRFLEEGFLLKGSTTTQEKLSLLQSKGISSYKIVLFEDYIEGNIQEFLSNSTILIVNIPPKLRKNNAENFVSKILILIAEIEKSSIQKVLFVSSTSVYNDDQLFVTEETKPLPNSESGKQLLRVEQILIENKNFETTIVRFGGLIGLNRHPIKMLSGKNDIENPDLPINLIHLNDCIEIILKIIKTNQWNEIFNAVYPKHLSKKEYYSQKAIEYNLTLPHFKTININIGKTVSSVKINSLLNYTFKNEV